MYIIQSKKKKNANVYLICKHTNIWKQFKEIMFMLLIIALEVMVTMTSF